MSTDGDQPSRRARAEAASWVTRLHGPDRRAEVEQGLRVWLAQDPAHAKAFELATEVWQETADLPGKLPPRDWEVDLPHTRVAESTALRPARHADSIGSPGLGLDGVGRGGARKRRFSLAAAAAGLAAVAVAAYLYIGREPTFATSVGEQRTLTLPDGSRVELNTSSQMVQAYDERTRRVFLKSGEAWFDVARDPQRPFIVVAGGREIAALGTSFVVRHEASELTVTLIEGKVSVSPVGSGSATPTSASPAGPSATILTPGQRLTVRKEVPVRVDEPEMVRVTAWQRGQVIFEDTPLQEAVAEFNRYSPRKLVCALPAESTECASIRVGGTFRVGDVGSFARAVAATHDLKVTEGSNQVVLTH